MPVSDDKYDRMMGKAAKRITALEVALKYVRSLAHAEQANPTELHMTCLSIIEKTADEALRN